MLCSPDLQALHVQQSQKRMVKMTSDMEQRVCAQVEIAACAVYNMVAACREMHPQRIWHKCTSMVLLCLVQPVSKVMRKGIFNMYHAAAAVHTCDAFVACAAADAAVDQQACLRQASVRSTNITHRILIVKIVLLT